MALVGPSNVSLVPNETYPWPDPFSPTGQPPIDLYYGQPVQKAIGVFTFVIIAVGLLGNSAVIYIVIRHRDMHTTTNFSFANLALTDILLLIFQALSVTLDTFGFGVSVHLNCWPTFYLRHVVGEVTGLTLAMMAYDRWRLVAHPLEAVKHTDRRKMLFLFSMAAVWIVSFAMYIPVIIYTVRIQTKLSIFCTIFFAWEYGQKVFQIYLALAMYIVPLAIISVCYLMILLKLRQKTPGSSAAGLGTSNRNPQRMRRTLRLIMVVIVVFAVSWLPYRVLLMWVVWDPNFLADSPLFLYASTICSLIIYLNSVANPFIYPFAGTGFRKHLPGFVREILARETTVSRNTVKRGGDDAQLASVSGFGAANPSKDTSFDNLDVVYQVSPQ